MRTVYTQLRLADAAAPPKVILVTSALPGEGKTSLAISLAMCAAQLRQKTLLIDLDLRQPAVGQRLGMQPEVGVLELIADDACQFDEVVQKDADGGVDVLAVAQGHRSPVPFLASDRLRRCSRRHVRATTASSSTPRPCLASPTSRCWPASSTR